MFTTMHLRISTVEFAHIFEYLRSCVQTKPRSNSSNSKVNVHLCSKCVLRKRACNREHSHHAIGTFMCAVKGSEGDHKESSRVFPSIDQVREGPLGVAITAQALDEPKPGRKTLDHCTDPVGVGITNISTCRGTQTHKFTVALENDFHSPRGYFGQT